MFYFKNRSLEPEILDDFALSGNDLTKNLAELEKVNTYLGGYRLITQAIEPLLQQHTGSKPFVLADVGCGGGDSLRAIAKWAERRKYEIQLTGLDANPTAVAYAAQQSAAFANIRYQQLDILSPAFQELQADGYMFNLFLHHFSNQQIIDFLTVCRQKKATVLINDLQRSKLAYHLFRLASKAMGFSYISRHDGKLSVQKSFTRAEWKQLLAEAGYLNYQISWKWAFRYLVTASALSTHAKN